MDVGSVRVGVAACDPSGMLAFPVETVHRGPGDLARIAALAAEYEAVEVVVGLPRSLSGRDGAAADLARGFARELAGVLAPVPVRLVDERMSTVSAGAQMRASGVSARKGRAAIDQAAAAVILQTALDSEQARGDAPGELVEPA